MSGSKCGRTRFVSGLRAIVCAGVVLAAAGAPGAEDPIVRLLKSGRLPEERLGTVVELACQRSGPDGLAYIFAQCVALDGFQGELRQKALEGLAEAATNRKVKPSGDLSSLGKLIAPDEGEVPSATRLAALRLAELWEVEALSDDLLQLATDADAGAAVRETALDALIAVDREAARSAVEELLKPEHEQRTRFAAVAGLAKLDVDEAAGQAARVLADSREEDDPAPLLDAFLGVKEGSDKLAAALAAADDMPAEDVAKKALRHLYAVGRSDAALVNALSDAAGIEAEYKPPSREEILEIVSDVTEHGDPERGERIFRRKDLNCFKCHSINGAGGDVGPDLIGLGGSSPPDYVVESVLLPNKAVKEEFQLVTVFTLYGKVYQGILKERNEDRIVLKDANGKLQVIPVEDIDVQREGGSMMPQGIAKFLTRGEIVDLARFLYELGRPGGAYERSTEPILRRWRVRAGEGEWETVYSQTSGELPLDEIAGDENATIEVQGQVEVNAAGELGIELNSSEGIEASVAGEPLDAQQRMVVNLPEGKHTIIFRIDPAARKSKTLLVKLFRPSGSTAEANVVAGT